MRGIAVLTLIEIWTKHPDLIEAVCWNKMNVVLESDAVAEAMSRSVKSEEYLVEEGAGIADGGPVEEDRGQDGYSGCGEERGNDEHYAIGDKGYN